MQGPGMQDGDEQRMTASLLKYLTKNRMHDEYCLKDPGDIELFEEIERIVRELPSSEKNLDVRTLWISIPRGPIEDFGDYEDYKEDYNYEEFVNLWKYEHPDEKDWYVFQYEKIPWGPRYVALGNLGLFCEEEDKSFRDYSRGHTGLLKWLVEILRETVDSVKDGTYHDLVVSQLPIGYRKGVVKRSDIWKSGYWSREDDLDGITDEEIERFIELVDGGIEQEPKEKLESMTLNDYLTLCSVCFRIFGRDIADKSPAEQFKRFADGRDEGLLELDPDDPDAFRLFCKSSHSGHVWEIFPGHSYSRIHLYPHTDENGWYLYLNGPFHRNHFVHIALELTSMGIPMKVYEAGKVVNALKGEDYIGIMPRGSFPQYCSHLFTEHEVMDCLSFREEMLEKFGDMIEWYGVNTFYPVISDSSKKD